MYVLDARNVDWSAGGGLVDCHAEGLLEVQAMVGAET